MRSIFRSLLGLTPLILGACTSNTAVSGPSSSAGTPSGNLATQTQQAGNVTYKVYFQPDASASTRKGIVLFGAGNDENDPSTGSLDGALENSAAQKLAGLGYVTAVVAYRDEPPLKANDDGASWNSNTAMLAADMSAVADAIIARQGGGLTRAKVLTGGVSYASYALLTNVAMNDSPLADTRGVLAACGATGEYEAQHFRVPVFSLNCAGNNEGDFNGKPLIDRIGDPKIKADSSFYTDAACNSHCGGNTATWTDQLVTRTQSWLP